MKTETSQAAPNGYAVSVAKKGAGTVGNASPDRGTGEFAIPVPGLKPGDELELVVKDPMAKPVPFHSGTHSIFPVTEKDLRGGVIDAGVVHVDLPPQESVEAFAIGGRVYDSTGKPLPNGFTMNVNMATGNRSTHEEIVDGKFALIFIDLQGEFPRITEGDTFVFVVKDKAGKVYEIDRKPYSLTRTDIANSSISTLEFKVKQ